MPLSISYTTPNTGAVAEYHVVTCVHLDYENATSTAYVASYLNLASKASGKFCMYQQQVQLDGMPASGQDARDYAEAELLAPIPTDSPPSPFANRYAFSGATIVS